MKSATAVFRLADNGILHIHYLAHAEVGRQEQIDNNRALIQLVGYTKHPLLIEGGEFASFTKEGLDTVKELELSAPILARAFVTRSLAQKIYVNFFLRFTSQIPMKTFESYENAVVWLLKFKID